MLSNWLKIYWKNTVKNKVYFVLTIVGLAIGIAALLLSVLFYAEESRYDQWNPNKDDVFLVGTHIDENNVWMTLSYPFGKKLKEISPHIIDFSYMSNNYAEGSLLVNGTKKRFTALSNVQSNFFDFIPLPIVKGNHKAPFSGKNTAVISEEYAMYLFGDEDAIGQTIEIDEENYMVSAVYALGGLRSSIASNILINTVDDHLDSTSWGNYNAAILLKLSDPSHKERVEKLIQEVLIEYSYKQVAKERGISLEDLLEEWGGATKYSLHVLGEQRLVTNRQYNGFPEGAGNVRMMTIFIGLSAIILLLSIVNYVNMTTAQMINRAREVGVRKALGAVKQSFWRQTFFETALTTFIALLLGLLIVELSLPYLRVFLRSKIELSYLVYTPLFAFIYVLIVVLVGTVPALFVGNFKPLEVLKGRIGITGRWKYLQNTLLIFQFVIASFFIAGAFIVQQQITYMLNKELGFRGDEVVSISLGEKTPREMKTETYLQLKDLVSKIEGVKGVSTNAMMWGFGASSSSAQYLGRTIQPENAAIDYNFFDLMNIVLKEGRMLSPEFASDSIQNVLVNEAFVVEMQEPDPIGKHIKWNGLDFVITGVVQNYHVYGFEVSHRPILYMHLKTVPWVGNTINQIFVKIDMQQAEKTLHAIEKLWEERDLSDTPFQYEFIDQIFNRSFNGVKKERSIFFVLNGVVVFIALFGLYGLASFNINNKLKEVAIRKVLGASKKELLLSLAKQYFVLGAIGFFLSIFLSYALLEYWLRSYAFRIEIGVLPFVLTFLCIMTLTMVTVFIKAYSATQVNVLKYIKYE